MSKQSKYNQEFRETAIRLAQVGDKPVSQVAKELGIDKHLLYSWIKTAMQKKQSSKRASKEQPVSAEQQLKELQRKYKQLETENEILKKAAAYFAKTLL
jgi:transposase-like protein